MSLAAQPEAPESILATLARWQSRIEAAKTKWEPDFERMKMNMRFAMGYQWPGQTDLDCDQYVSNITLRSVNMKVASLYARNPKAIARPRKRLEYMVWDEKRESLALAIMRGGADVESAAIIEDYWQGSQLKVMLERIARTLEAVYQYQIDRHEPEFKKQMKRLVRRAVITGVGFVRLRFERQFESSITSNRDDNVVTMARQAQEILERIIEGEVHPTDAEAEQLRVLQLAMSQQPEARLMTERLVFDFPPATSIIVDPSCESLHDFVGADWIVQEYVMPIRECNEYFEVDVQQPTVESKPNPALPAGQPEDALIEVWEVFDKRTQTCFFMANGHKDYLAPPQPVYPRLHRFWPVFALTFNDIESECGEDSTIYPPSDVQLLKSAQREWNRTREELRNHRNANRPKYVTPSGSLTEQDLSNLESTPSSGIIQLQSLQPGQKAGDVLQPVQHVPVDPTLYDITSLKEDVMFTTGQQEANLGPAPSNVTATVGTIAEQSRLSVTSSNVDDLDEFLSDLAKAGGETLMLNMQLETVKAIAGPGAVWPETDRELFANEVMLEIEAASSGRPNRAVEIANFERMAPLLAQAGANPMFLVREGVKRLDDRLDVDEAFPLLPAANPMVQPQGNMEGSAQPLQTLPSESPVPLVGHNQ